MKRQITILFTLLYFTLTVGVAKSTHYCMGQVKSVAYFSFDGSTCFDAPADEPIPCCDDEVELLKIEEDHQNSKLQTDFTNSYTLLPVFTVMEFTSLLNDSEEVIEVAFESPPPIEDKPIYLINCSFTFYG